MACYIDRDALFSYLIKSTGFRTNCDGCTDIDCVDCIANEAIKRFPTIVAPVRHGRWVDHCVRDWRCSECGDKIIKFRSVDGYCYDDKPNFCPNCGAKMDLNGETEDG